MHDNVIELFRPSQTHTASLRPFPSHISDCCCSVFFAFSFSHLTLVASPLQAIPMCSELWTKRKKKHLCPHSQMYAWPFTHTSIHAYCKDKKSLLYMNGQHRLRIDAVVMHIYLKKGLSWLDCEFFNAGTLLSYCNTVDDVFMPVTHIYSLWLSLYIFLHPH